MSNPSQAPYYKPARHLTNRSLLTSEQLIHNFEDFYASMERMTVAPELVFERLVANLSDDFAANIESAQVGDRTGRQVTLQQNQGQQSRNIIFQSVNHQLEAALAELKIAIPNQRHDNDTTTSENSSHELQSSCDHLGRVLGELNVAYTQLKVALDGHREPVLLSKFPGIGTFNTAEAQSNGQSRITKPNLVSFVTRYEEPPLLPLGITSFCFNGRIPFKITTSASNIQNDGCEINIRTSYGMDSGVTGCTWPEVEPNNIDFQCGSCIPISIDRGSGTSTQRSVTFPRRYSTPPQVIVYIGSFRGGQNKDFKLVTSAVDITCTGFTIYISHYKELEVTDVSVSWVSCTALKEGVYMNSLRTTCSGSKEITDHIVRRSTTSTPRVMVAINEIWKAAPLELEASVWADISSSGITWHVSCRSSTVPCIGFSVLAVG